MKVFLTGEKVNPVVSTHDIFFCWCNAMHHSTPKHHPPTSSSSSFHQAVFWILPLALWFHCVIDWKSLSLFFLLLHPWRFLMHDLALPPFLFYTISFIAAKKENSKYLCGEQKRNKDKFQKIFFLSEIATPPILLPTETYKCFHFSSKTYKVVLLNTISRQ